MVEYVLKQNLRAPGAPRIDYRALLNEQQYRAVTTVDGPVLVIAGAGSGKTRTLVHRAAYLVEQGVAPEAILLLTFTRKAAQEMMHRAAGLLDDRCTRISGGTFHSFANIVLRSYAPLLGYEANFTILDPADMEAVMDVVRSQALSGKPDKRLPKSHMLLAMQSRAVNIGRPLREVVAEEYGQYYQEFAVIERILRDYGQYKKTRAMMDYDDLLLNLCDLLEHYPKARETLSAQFQYIMVDEYQDTNPLQARIVYGLTTGHCNVLACGDDAQSIYSFRGASFANIMDFPGHYPGCQVIKLEQNYRSTQPILALTNAIIANMPRKYAKTLYSDQGATQRPVYVEPANVYEEACFICQRVLELREEGVPLRDIAVLFRAASHSNELEIELGRRNIPFRKFGGIKFLELAHVKDFISFMRVIGNPKDEPSWMRVLKLHEGIGVQTAVSLMNEVVTQGKGLAALQAHGQAGKRYSPAVAQLHAFLSEVRQNATTVTEVAREVARYYGPLLRANYVDEGERRENDIVSLVGMAERAVSLERFLSDFVLEPPAGGTLAAAGDDEEYLTLSTIHTAKGLEWHAVFLISLVDGCLPISYAWKPEAIEEERRMFYVAATRAKKELYLTRPCAGLYRSGGRTPFINEIGAFRRLTEEWRLAGETGR